MSPSDYPLLDPDTGTEIERLGAKAVPTDYGNDNEAILAACLDNESSYEIRDKQAGLFTHHLLAAINNGAANLEAAFEVAKIATLKDTEDFQKQSRGKHNKQTPSLTDPHGYVKIFRFGR